MLIVDGQLLFKLYLLTVLHELFEQRHLSLQVQNGQLDDNYRLLWLEICTRVIKKQLFAMQLIDFCMTLFRNFSPCHRRLFTDNKFKPQMFAYSLASDKKCGFSVGKFLLFLRHGQPIGYESEHVNKLRTELVQLLEPVAAQRYKRGGCGSEYVNFGWRDYGGIIKTLAAQYELKCDGHVLLVELLRGKGVVQYEIKIR